jgi:SAM-dependent methyltransferase
VTALADAYEHGAAAWAAGPSLVYGPLADLLVAFSPEPVAGRLTLEVGSGTGEGSRAALAAGARVIASDLAPGMLLLDRGRRPPAVAGDAVLLPFRNSAFDIVLAPFSLNHLADPGLGVREAARVAPLLLASTYAADDDHPAKAAVETALQEEGWERPDWYTNVKAVMTAWGTVDAVTTILQRSALDVLRVERLEVAFPHLGPVDMVAWRQGLAQCAPFVASLSAEARARSEARALEILGPDPEPIVRRVIFAAGRRAS